jgi:septin family protein
MQQLEFFPISSEERFDQKVKEFKETLDKIRKSLFHRNSQLEKELSETRHELETLKQAICKNHNLKDLF